MEALSILETCIQIKRKRFPFLERVSKSHGNLCFYFGPFLGVSKTDKGRPFQEKDVLWVIELDTSKANTWQNQSHSVRSG